MRNSIAAVAGTALALMALSGAVSSARATVIKPPLLAESDVVLVHECEQYRGVQCIKYQIIGGKKRHEAVARLPQFSSAAA